jgi:multicomponent Na+:H+ antiporter subunit A
VLERLPEYYGDLEPEHAVRDAALSLVVGVTVFFTVVFATGNRTEESIARYFVEQAIPGGGGSNVVNVILVDFRGFDTLGETAVVAMAALSALLLMSVRNRGDLE